MSQAAKEASRKQLQAANPATSVWVSASAGTGKTKVLTDRVLNLLLAGTPAHRILCLTYTKTAAAEMLERIHQRLSNWITIDDSALRKQLAELGHEHPDARMMTRARSLFAEIIDRPQDMHILTIHSFCQSLLGRFPLEAGIPPHFSIVEGEEAKALMHEARERLLSNEGTYPYSKDVVAEAIVLLASQLHESRFNELLKEISSKRSLFRHHFATPHSVERSIETLYRTLGAKKGESEEEIIARACADSAFDCAALRAAAEQLLGSGKEDREKGERIAAFLAAQEQRRHTGFDLYTFAYFSKSTDEPYVKVCTDSLSKKHPELAPLLKRECERIRQVREAVRAQRTARLTEALIHVAEALFVIYDDLKEKQAMLDYEDLILKTIALLGRSDFSAWIMYKLDGGIDHILVDEAQDTSEAQWQIVRALSTEFFSGESAQGSERTLFVVGDEKQSIFSFQGADPAMFRAMESYFESLAKDATKSWQPVDLDTSFRSSAPILDLVDTLFNQQELKRYVTSSATAIKHRLHRAEYAGSVSVWPEVEGNAKEDLPDWPIPKESYIGTAVEDIMADKIAEYIAETIQNKTYLFSKGRAARPSDFLILIQKRNILPHAIIRALKKRYIPVSGSDRLIITEHLAVMDLIALGRFLLLPDDDFNLTCLLKSPLFAFNEEALFRLAYGRGKTSIWERLQNSPEYKHAASYLHDLRERTDFTPPFELYSHVLEVLGGKSLFVGRFGQECLEPLQEFMALALEYESRRAPSLEHFLHWLERSDIEIKRSQESTRDEVRIMTVHGSKGLQAPIVILPDTHLTPNNTRPALLMDKEGSLFWPARRENMNSYCKDLAQAEKDRQYAEYIRLMYVALTRAEDHLVIGAIKPERGSAYASWYTHIRTALKSMPGMKETEGVLQVAHPMPLPVQFEASAETRVTPLSLRNLGKKPAKAKARSLTASGSGSATITSILDVKQSMEGRERGVILHRLLELLPQADDAHVEDFAFRFLKQRGLRIEDAVHYAKQLIDIIRSPTHKIYFGPDSRAEVTIAGIVEGEHVSWRIDRLAVTPTAIHILDYKTDDTPYDIKEIPARYLRQMALYRMLAKQLYPNRNITCALLWTSLPLLQEIPDAILDSHTPFRPS